MWEKRRQARSAFPFFFSSFFKFVAFQLWTHTTKTRLVSAARSRVTDRKEGRTAKRRNDQCLTMPTTTASLDPFVSHQNKHSLFRSSSRSISHTRTNCRWRWRLCDGGHRRRSGKLVKAGDETDDDDDNESATTTESRRQQQASLSIDLAAFPAIFPLLQPHAYQWLALCDEIHCQRWLAVP